MASHPKVLLPMQRAFAREFVKLGNAADAVRAAGYKTKHPATRGYQMLRRNEGIRRMIKALRDEQEIVLGISREKVLAHLWDTAEQARKDRDHAQRRQSLESLAKLMGYAEPLRVEVTVRDGEAAVKEFVADVENMIDRAEAANTG